MIFLYFFFQNLSIFLIVFSNKWKIQKLIQLKILFGLFETPEEKLFDKNRNKLDGTHKKVIVDGSKEDEYNRFGNKINGTFRKLESDLPGVDAYDKNGKKLDGKYANVIACLPTDDIFDKKGNKLKGLWIKSNPVKNIIIQGSLKNLFDSLLMIQSQKMI